ncbi:hypothetical protein NC653_027930 [Populus alba x Populus x berolinensis]|uniref:NAC domain-containing protein n=1 Tax=Populus alba x Populus x berolinensis TaxID=444605 RepID=A0AAD6Q5K8_9ROSI|nr:hypothetical protein NC653_027930 [Populus alba x Populus x berolinensis]
MATSQSQTLATLTPIQLLPGYRFNPYDEELVRFFLYPKLTNPCFTTSAPVRDCNLYACQPLQIWNTFRRIHGEDVFFFTDLKRKSPNSNVSRKIAGGPATWHREDKDHQVCVQIDKNYSVTALKKGFSYRNTQPHQPGCSWMMYEYSLPSLSQVTVLCQLRRKDDDNSHQSTQKNKKRKRADADDVDDAANIISQKARVDQHDQQQHNMGFYRASETVSEEVVNGVRFKDFESFYRQNVQDFDSCEMVANSTTSTTGHVSPTTVSTLNPDENFKPFEVFCIDNDGEAAANENDREAAAKEDGDLHQEILGMLNSTDCSDKADVVPAIEAAPVQVDGVQATQVGSILIESFTSEVVENHPDSEVSDDSSLWIESFPPAFAQANPTCGLIQENKIQMIPNPFFMDCFY